MASWTKSTWTDAGQIAFMIDPDAPDGAATGHALDAWYARLVQGGDLAGAAMFLGHALPRYECVVWALRSLIDAALVDRANPLVVAVLRWIDSPDDDLRRAAGDLADAERRNSPARYLAQAVFYSGGSIAPRDLAPVQPPPDLCAKLAAGAVLSAAYASGDPAQAMRAALAVGEPMVTGSAG